MAFVLPFLPALAGALGASSAVVGLVTVVSTLASGFLAARERRKQEAAARDAYNASLRDRTQMVRSTTEGRDLVLGRVRKSGQIAFIAAAGARKEKLYIVLALAGHECDAVEAFYFNDVEVAVDGSGNVTTAPYVRFERQPADAIITLTGGAGSVAVPNVPIAGSARAVRDGATGLDSYNIAATISGSTISVSGVAFPDGTQLRVSYEWNRAGYYAQVRSYLGTDSQTADAGLMAAFPGIWTANHRLRGVCYVVAELLFNDDVFTSGIPNISVRMRGAKVFDPRTSTTAWSENPSLLMRHAALSPLCGRLSGGQINDTTVIAAANVCDQDVTYSVVINGVATAFNRKRFTAGAVFKSGSRPKEALDDLATAMAGDWCFSANQLMLRAGAYTSPVLSLGDDDFSDAGGVEIQPFRPREQLFNVVTATFADELDSYRVVPMPRVAPSSYIALDGAELPIQVEFAAINFSGQAQYVAGIMLRDARQALTITASFKMRAYPLQVLDVIALTSSRYGWSGKPFKVLNRRWTLDGMIQLTLKEIDASIYTMDASFPSGDAAPNTNLPTPWVVAALTGLAGSSGTSTLLDGTPQTRARLTWTQHTEEQVLRNGFVQIQFTRADQPLPADDWPSEQVPGSAVEATIVGLTAGAVYLFRARALSTLGRSPWTPLLALRIAEAPSVETFTARYLAEFRNTADGWVGYAVTGTSMAVGANAITVSSTGTDPVIYAGAAAGAPLSIDGTVFDRVRVRLRRLAGTGWDGRLYYETAGHTWSNLYRGDAAAPPPSGWAIVEWDARNLAFGGNDWVTNVITGLRLDFGNTAADVFEVDWIAVGRLAPVSIGDLGYTGDLNATADIVLIASAGMSVAGNVATKTSVDAGTYNAGVYSRDSYTGGAYAQAIFAASATNRPYFGLNSDPATDNDYASIDYALHFSSDGNVYASESGTLSAALGTWSAGDVGVVAYDGASVRYMRNGTVLRTVAAAAGLRLFFDSAFKGQGDSLRGIRFGPLSPVTNIGTGQLQNNAATEILLATYVAGPVSFSSIA